MKVNFYRLAGRWWEHRPPIYEEFQEWNPFRWEIRLFAWGIIIY